MNSAIASALMHFLWQGAVIACALAIALIFVRAPRFRYGLAFVALLAMPAVFALTMWLALPVEPAPSAIRFAVPWTIGILDSEPSSPVTAPFSWNLVSLWMTGAALVCAYRLAGWLAAQRLRRVGICLASMAWQQRMSHLSRQIGLRSAVRLLESALAEVPLTIGFWRPVILMPLGLLAGLPTQQAEAILLHELAHISRYDYLINLFQAAVEAVLFYHPATWWISHVMRRERELCCDDMVIEATGDRALYAKALGALTQYRAQQPILAATGGPLMQRIHRLLGHPAPRGASMVPALVFLTLAGAAGLLAYRPEPLPLPEPAPFQQSPTQPSPAPAPKPQIAKPVPQQIAQEAAQPAPPPPSEVVAAVGLTYQQRRRFAAQLRRELESPYKRWLNEEVIWIVSDDERAAFGRLETDDERQQFIEQFWLRRDPTPGTEQNELKEEHYRRIAWANDHFATAIPGWKTDRGMIYVKFGAPDEKEQHPDNDGPVFPYEKWRYKYLEGIGQDVTLEFVDPSMTNEYRLTWNPEDKNALLRVPGEGLKLYEQMGRGYVFDRLRAYMNVQRPPAK